MSQCIKSKGDDERLLRDTKGKRLCLANGHMQQGDTLGNLESKQPKCSFSLRKHLEDKCLSLLCQV